MLWRRAARLKSGMPARAMRRGFAVNIWMRATMPSSNVCNSTAPSSAAPAAKCFSRTECSGIAKVGHWRRRRSHDALCSSRAGGAPRFPRSPYWPERSCSSPRAANRRWWPAQRRIPRQRTPLTGRHRDQHHRNAISDGVDGPGSPHVDSHQGIGSTRV